MSWQPLHRYVAIGDSSTEGLDDPDGRGGYRGWADRLAASIAAAQGGLRYANLGVRGKRTREIKEEQLDRAVAMTPDLVTIFSGTNDVVARRFAADEVARDIAEIHHRLINAGAVVVTFTLPDLTPVMPLARLVRDRVEALNDVIRTAALSSGARLVDVARFPVASDPRLWSEDRLHANSAGHARIAAALAQAIDLPGSGDGWSEPLPPLPPPTLRALVLAELRWGKNHLAPWVWRHLRGRSSGDGISPKREALATMGGVQDVAL